MNAPLAVSKRRTGRPSERGATLIETVIASTMVVFVAMILAASASGFAASVRDLREETDVLVESQLARNRFMVDSVDAVSFLCTGAAVLQLVIDGTPPPISTIEYRLSGGDLHRVNVTTGLDITVAEDLVSITCADLGGGELDVTLTFGDAQTQTRLLLRVTQSGVGP